MLPPVSSERRYTYSLSAGCAKHATPAGFACVFSVRLLLLLPFFWSVLPSGRGEGVANGDSKRRRRVAVLVVSVVRTKPLALVFGGDVYPTYSAFVALG